jgi:hypothetical protein
VRRLRQVPVEHTAAFRGYLEKAGPGRITVYEDAEQLIRSGELHVIDDFFRELSRYGR